MKRLLIFAVFLLTAQFGFATVHHVPATYSTIQAALNACSTGDTVLVAPGTYYENITWPSTQSILLKSESGAALTIIDGGSISNVIVIITGVDNTTIIDGFTIKNGYDGAGGGIGIRYSSPTIKNNIITQNTAYETPANIGGGGGMAVGYNSSPIIVDNVFIYNSATASGGGGFLCGFNSHPIIHNNTFENNSAATGGGAILIHNDCSATITNNLIKYNKSYVHGGGIYFQQANSMVQNNLIEYNTADGSGGGIGIGWPDISLVDNNTIRYNLAHEGGGGIGLLEGALSTISNNIISHNSADSTGGGIFCFDNSNGQILNNVLKHNEADYGGGIHCYQYSNPEITGNTIDSNKAFLSGGGIRCRLSSPQILNNTISFNLAQESGGGIYLYESSMPEISNNIISGNSADWHGGGIECYLNSSPMIANNEIFSNEADSTGGGIVCSYGSSPIIENNRIKYNTALWPGGGGIVCAYANTDPLITQNYIIGNESGGAGGGLLCVYDSYPTIEHNVIDSNYCEYSGGGAIIYECSALMENNEIKNNTAVGSGGGIHFHISASTLRYNFIENNSGPLGAGICFGMNDQSSLEYNSISYNFGTGLHCEDGSTPTINYNNICDNTGYGVNNIDPSVTVDAQFNWWDDQNGPGGFGPGNGDEVSDYVNFANWLEAPVTVPVELTSFTATCIAGKVTLDWTTATEVNNQGFEIERRIINNEEQGEWILIGFREGNGTTAEPKKYSYTDNIGGLTATSLAYRLKQIDFNGSFEYSDEVFVDNIIPVGFALDQNYPNPFNPATTISYSVPVKSYISLKVFNALGMEVLSLFDEEQPAGKYQVKLNAANLASGVYFYRLEAGSFSKTRKMILLR